VRRANASLLEQQWRVTGEVSATQSRGFPDNKTNKGSISQVALGLNQPDQVSSRQEQWLSTLFGLVHTFKFARKPVHPCHALKFSAVNVQNVSDFYAVNVTFSADFCVSLLSIP